MNLRIIPLLHIKNMKKKHSCIYMNHNNKEGSICSLFYHKFYKYKIVEKGWGGKPYHTYCFSVDIMKSHCDKCLSYKPKLETR